MRTGVLATLILFTISTCSAQQISFERMSDEELFIHNQSLAAEEQIFCMEDVRTGSRIHRRTCATIKEWAELSDGSRTGRLGTASSSSSFGR